MAEQLPSTGLPISISHSRVEAFLACRRRDWYGYRQRLEKKETSLALGYGKASHRVLDAYYLAILRSKTTAGQRKLIKKAEAAAWAEYAKLENEGWQDPDNRVPLRTALERYFANEPFVRRGWLILESEAAYNLRISDEISYTFIVDLIVKDPQGRIVVVDHKNQYDFISADEAKLLPQIPKYIGALRALGKYDPEYGIYNQIRTRVVNGPTMKKADLQSVLQVRALKDGWELPEGFEKLTVDKLKALCEQHGIATFSGPTLDQQLQVLEVAPTDHRIVETFRQQVAVAEELAWFDTQDDETVESLSWRTASKMVCQNCSYRILCYTELADPAEGDVVRDAYYQEKEHRDGVPLTEDDIEG